MLERRFLQSDGVLDVGYLLCYNLALASKPPLRNQHPWTQMIFVDHVSEKPLKQ